MGTPCAVLATSLIEPFFRLAPWVHRGSAGPLGLRGSTGAPRVHRGSAGPRTMGLVCQSGKQHRLEAIPSRWSFQVEPPTLDPRRQRAALPPDCPDAQDGHRCGLPGEAEAGLSGGRHPQVLRPLGGESCRSRSRSGAREMERGR